MRLDYVLAVVVSDTEYAAPAVMTQEISPSFVLLIRYKVN